MQFHDEVMFTEKDFIPGKYVVLTRINDNNYGWWIFDKKYTGWVYENTERALDAVLNNMSFDEDAKLIQSCINQNVPQSAQLLIDKYRLEVV